MSRVFRIFVAESLLLCISTPGPVVKCGRFFVSLHWINYASYFCICTVALGNAAVFSFCPEWPFLSRFPGLLVPGGITYRFCREMPLNRKFGKIKVVRDFRTTKDDYLMAGNKTIKNYVKIFGN